jgi:hypothetical protein
MARLNLTSTEARTRIKAEINDRYREVASSVNMASTRRGVTTFTTVSGDNEVTQSGVAKVLSVFDPTYLRRPLGETTLNQIRMMDAPLLVVGIPYLYAVTDNNADLITLFLWPQPTAVNVLNADCLLAGTDMDSDSDEPAFPVDYHDVLVHGVMSDELMKMEKLRPLAQAAEGKFEKRLSELRYFIIKSAYLSLKQTDNYARFGLSARVWPYANLGV